MHSCCFQPEHGLHACSQPGVLIGSC
jgi:hypothetical protein